MNKIEINNGMTGVYRGDDTHTNIINSEEDDQIGAHYTIYEAEPPVKRLESERIDNKDLIYWNESVEGKLPSIPDGGWGWIVVVSAFIISVCVKGVASSFSLFLQDISQDLEGGSSNTYSILHIFTITSLFSGPIMSVLVDQYGCRNMTIIAGLLSTCAFILSAISNSITVLYLTLGFMNGLGVGILHVTSIVSVVFWFEKRRNIAVSLASCGISFSVLIYYLLTHYALKVYKWRHILTLLSGNLLIICLCGMLMRNPKWLKLKQKREHRLSKIRSKTSAEESLITSRSHGGETAFNAEKFKVLLQSGKTPEYILATLASSLAEVEELKATSQINAEHPIHSPTFVQQNEEMWYRRSAQSKIDFKMVLFSVSYFMLSLWSYVPYSFLVMTSTYNLHVFIDIASGIGTVVFGWIGDQTCVNVTKTYAGCLIICGLSVAAYPLFTNTDWALTIVSIIFGFSFASTFPYTPAMLMELMPIEHFTTSYGVLLLIRGIAFLPTPYIMVFLPGSVQCYVGGICLVISGCCVMAFLKR